MSFRRPFADRERAFEEAFFRKESARLINAMHEREARGKQLQALSAAAGVDDEKVLNPLIDLGVNDDNVAALVLAPLIAVAWADRILSSDERRALLQAESAHGIDPESESGKLFASWLDHRPHERLIDAWAAYMNALCESLEPAERKRLQDDISARANRMAHSPEKTLLRGGGPTEAELAVLEKIEAAFETGGDAS